MSDTNNDDVSEPVNPENSEFDQQIQEVTDKLQVDVDWARLISPEEVLYLLDHCPFLQIVNTGVGDQSHPVKLVESESGWTIHDYGDAMSSSPGKFLYGGGYFRVYLDDEDDGGDEGGGIVNPGKGTIRNQAFVTAIEMIAMAKANGWEGIRVVDGHPSMVRAAWIKGGELGLRVDGFEPTKDDYRVRELVELSANELEVRKLAIRPSVSSP